MSQNIYDNETFFEGYRNLRKQEYNYNTLQEQPAMRSLLPDLKGKTVLDLGCGFGCNCIDFAGRGAISVLGADISEKMLAAAAKENVDLRIKYLRLDMNDLDELNEKFDFVYSSLAFHYIADFNRLISNIGNLLNKDGILLFSQEHPFTTASLNDGGCWQKDESGEKTAYTFSHYMVSGERKTKWFVDGVIKYHRPFSEIINILVNNNFCIENLTEPVPGKDDLEKLPALKKDFHKPNFLIIKAKKI